MDELKPNDSSAENIFLYNGVQSRVHGLKDIVLDNWDLPKRSQATKVLAENELIIGYRRPPNLKDILVRAWISRIEENKSKTPCSQYGNRYLNTKCQFCPALGRSGHIRSTYCGREYESKQNVTCHGSNLIYCITRKSCKEQYAGQTGDYS